METTKHLLLVLLKDFTTTHTITSLSKELKLSRVGIWKILQKLAAEQYLLIKTIGSGKTSTSIISINWDNLLIKKTLALYLTEESLSQRRWQVNFAALEPKVDVLILYGSILTSPQQAQDIDLLGIAKQSKFLEIQKISDKIQKTEHKKIHQINFTASELKTELKNDNKAFIDAIKRGIVLFGQENIVKFVSEIVK